MAGTIAERSVVAVQDERGIRVTSPDQIRAELIEIANMGTAALVKMVDVYYRHRTPERDLYWLSLQCSKEYFAIDRQNKRFKDLVAAGAPIEEVAHAHEAMIEEVNHYYGYKQIMDWLLDGKPNPIENWMLYGDFGYWWLHGPKEEIKKYWPHNWNFQNTVYEVISSSHPWTGQIVAAFVEGGAAGWHWAMSRLPQDDEFLRRVTECEAMVAGDELYHGPETVVRLANECPSEAEYQKAKQAVLHIRGLEIWQRNEQYMHPLSDAEVQAMVDDLMAGKMENIGLYDAIMTSAA